MRFSNFLRETYTPFIEASDELTFFVIEMRDARKSAIENECVYIKIFVVSHFIVILDHFRICCIPWIIYNPLETVSINNNIIWPKTTFRCRMYSHHSAIKQIPNNFFNFILHSVKSIRAIS